MIAIGRRRRTPQLLLGLHRTIPVSLLLVILQHCCPALHHYSNAAQAFIIGSPPSFLARHHLPSAVSVGGGSGGAGFRAFSTARSRRQNEILTTLLTATNINAISEDREDDNEPQRTVTYKKRGKHTALAPSKKAKKSRVGWEAHFQLLEEFQKEHGHCQVPQNYLVNNHKLGRWVNTQRAQYKSFKDGKYSTLTPERIDALETLGFNWSTASIRWEGHFQKLVEYKEMHGHCRVPQNHSVDNVNLGIWVKTQRSNYQKYLAGKYSPLTQEQIDQLNTVGFDWGIFMTDWKGTFEKLVQFKESHGHCRVQTNYSVDDFNLGIWVKTQRYNYQKYLAGKYSPMTQERIDQLNSVGFDWGSANIGWKGTFQKLVQYKESHGHCRVPRNYTVDDANLGNWVANQRNAYKRFKDGQHSTMTQERIDQLNSVGFDWGTTGIGWEGHFQKLVQFQAEHGHCGVPQNYSIDNVKLGKWVSHQRSEYQNHLAGKYSPMTQERIDQLNSVGFDWGTTVIGWDGHFEKLVQFKEVHGHCQVPQKYSVNDVNLGNWVSHQRSEYQNHLTGKYSPMTQERIDQLNSVGFVWGTAMIGWEGSFEKLVQFKESHGHCQVPRNYTADDVNLGNWVANQRKAYKRFKDGRHSTMTQERIDALENIGFKWKVYNV